MHPVHISHARGQLSCQKPTTANRRRSLSMLRREFFTWSMIVLSSIQNTDYDEPMDLLFAVTGVQEKTSLLLCTTALFIHAASCYCATQPYDMQLHPNSDLTSLPTSGGPIASSPCCIAASVWHPTEYITTTYVAMYVQYYFALPHARIRQPLRSILVRDELTARQDNFSSREEKPSKLPPGLIVANKVGHGREKKCPLGATWAHACRLPFWLQISPLTMPF